MTPHPIFKPVAALAIASLMMCNSPAAADLLANWRLDEASGPALSDANATFVGTVSGAIQNQPGKIGTAYSFSGGSNVNVNPGGASAPSAPAPSPTGTISAWIQPTAGNWSGNIVYLQNPSYIQFRLEAANNLTYRQDGAHDRVVSTGAGVITDGVWTHVAATVSPSSITLYINGSPITTGAGSNGYVSNDSTFLQIGSGAGVNFEGSIDDVALWNTVLSEGKIMTLANTLAVNGSVLNDYNAFMMDKLFTAYDTGISQSVNSTIGNMTWSKFTGQTGTSGSVTYDTATFTYKAFFDNTSGVFAIGPLIIGNGTTNIGTVGSNIDLIVNGSTAVANLTADVVAQSVYLKNGGSITGSFSLNQTGGVTATSGSITSNLTGSGGVMMNGNGNTLTLIGDNAYTGTTTISGGTLEVGNGGTTGNLGSGDVIDNGTLSFNRSDSLTDSHNISGSGNLTQSGSGTLTLSGANTYTGATTVNSGTLTTSGADKISDSSAVTVNSGGTFSLGGSESVGSIAGSGNFSLNAYTLTAGGDNSSTTFSGNMNGTGSLTKTGTGTLTLSGANTYTGATTVNSGTLATSGADKISDSSAVTVNSGGTFSLGGSESIGSIAGAGNLNLNAYTLTAGGDNTNTSFTGVISSNAGISGVSLNKIGTGQLQLDRANTFTGKIVIDSGKLYATEANGSYADAKLGAVPSSFVADSITIKNGGTLNLASGADGRGLSAYRGIYLDGTGINYINTGSGDFYINGVISGSGSLGHDNLIGGYRRLYLNANNTFTGDTYWNASGSQSNYGGIQMVQALALQNSAVRADSVSSWLGISTTAGALQLGGLVDGTGNVRSLANLTNNGQFTNLILNPTVAGIVKSYSGVIGGTNESTTSLTKTGAGIQELNGANTFTGATAIKEGELRINSIKNIGGAANSLGQPMTVTNGTISMGNGSTTGTLTYSGSGDTTDRVVNLSGTTGGAVLDMSGTNTLTFTSNFTATGSGAKTLTLQGSTTGTGLIYGQIVDSNNGATSVTKNGIGTWTLGGVNTYTGDTTLIAGTLTLGTNLSIQNSALNYMGGTLALSSGVNTPTFGGLSGSTNFSLTSNVTSLTLNVGTGQTKTYTGTLGSDGAQMTLTKSGTGVQILGSTTFAGSIVVNDGKLVFNGDNAYTGTTTISGGTLEVGNGGTTGNLGSGDVIDNGTLSFNRSDSLTDSHNISGSGNLTQSGSGTLTLSGTNTYTGATTVNSGTLATSGADKISDSSAVTVNSGGTFSLGGSETVGSIAGSGNFNLNSYTLTAGGDNTSTTLSGLISGTGGFVKTGTGTLTINGTNTYTGGTSIQGGTMLYMAFNFSPNGGTFNIGNVTVSNGATLQTSRANFQGNMTMDGGTWYEDNGFGGEWTGSISLNSTSTFNTGYNIPNYQKLNGEISGSGGLIKTGIGKLIFNGNNTYTGTTTISGGTLEVGSGGTTGTLGSGNIIDNGTLAFNRSDSISVSNDITGSGNLTQTGSGKTTLIGNNDYTGTTTISSGTLEVGNGGTAGTLGSGNVIDNGTLSYNRSDSLTDSHNISGTGNLTKTGAGTLTLSGTNTYTGATTVNSGTLATSGANKISDSSAVTVNSGGTFSLGGSETVGSIAGSGNFSLNAYTLTTGGDNSSTTFSGNINGTGALTKTGAGTLTLSGTNTYTGSTTISGGTLELASGGRISHSGASLYTGYTSGENGTLILNGGSLSNYGGYIGYNAGSVGIVNVNNGTWTNADNLRVGYHGNGSLNLSEGFISNDDGYIGKFANSTGVANVSNGTWSNSGSLTVGDAGTGKLILSAGNVTNSNGMIGNETTGTGIVNVGGGTWANSGNLTLGNNGVGSLNLAGNGTVSVGGMLTLANGIGSNGTLNLGTGTGIGTGTGYGNGIQTSGNANNANSSAFNLALGSCAGTLLAAEVHGGNGTAIVNFNQNGNYTFAPGMTGNLSVNHIGTGTTTLTGMNTYTGATTISSGTLSVESASAIANTSGISMGNGTGFTYNGSTGAISRSFAITSGTGTLRNSGGGTLSLTGTLSKNGTTLKFAQGAFNITGSIIGSNANSDLVVDGANVILNGINTYNGPTYLLNGATLTANATGALPTQTRSAVTMDVSGTGGSTLALGSSQAIASLTGAASSNVTLGSNTLTIGSNTDNTTFAGQISGPGDLVKDGASQQVLSGVNTFTGNTTINNGTLQVNATNALQNTMHVDVNGGSFLVTASNSVNDNAAINLNGGTLAMDGTVGEVVGALTLSANSTLDMGTGSAWISFAGLVAQLTNTTRLNIYNYTIGSDAVYFANSASVENSLNYITFYSDLGQTSLGNAFFNAPQVHTAIVPETSTTVSAIILLSGLALMFIRKSQRGKST